MGRILLGAVRGLAFLYLLISAGLALACDELPAGQTLWIRLSSTISTYSTQVGDPVHAVLTQDLTCGKDILLPMGTPIDGFVRNKRKVGWGIRHETAALELEFTQAAVGEGPPISIAARVEEVENAREHVKNGVIHGVMSSDTFQGRVNSRLIHLPTWNPYSDIGLIIYKATFPIFPEPEIFYPSGTDLRLKTTDPLSTPSIAVVGSANLDSPDVLQLDVLVDQVPRRTTTRKEVDADLVNLMFVGSQSQVESAFRTAGWHTADPVSRHSIGANFYALLNNSGYSQEPMKTFLLDGKPQDMNWQKSLNSYGRRDHLRVWQYMPEGATQPVWLSSSTHDTGAVLSVKYKGFVHRISPDIDDERAKVIRDLNFVGCVQSVTIIGHPGSSRIVPNATGDVMRTDGSIAVVQLKDCQPIDPELSADASGSHFKPGNHVFRYLRKEILTFRSDIWRANIIYGLYDVGRRSVLAIRHQPLPPLSPDQSLPVSAAVASSGSPSGAQ